MIPTCGATRKRTGTSCLRYPCKNGRCHLHGGKSTGPKTEAGRRKCAEAKWKHGLRSKEAIEERKNNLAFLRQCDDFLGEFAD